MLHTSFASVVVVWVATVPGGQDEQIFSGPQVGEKVFPLNVRLAYGDKRGEAADFVTDASGKPVLLIFVHELTRPALQLMRPLDHYGLKRSKEGLETRFVWLTDDPGKTDQYLQRAKKSLNLQSPVGISLDGPEGPGAYGLNRRVSITVLLAKANRVTANFAIVQPNATDAAKVGAEIAKLLGGPAPSLEEMLPEGRRRYMRRKAAKRKTAKKNLPGKIPDDEKLVGLLRRLIRKDNTAEQVNAAAEEITKYVGDSQERKVMVREACKRLLHVKYGTEPAQVQMRRWLKEFSG